MGSINRVIPGRPEGPGPETMNTCLSRTLEGPCSWIPGSRAAPAPRDDNALLFFHAL